MAPARLLWCSVGHRTVGGRGIHAGRLAGRSAAPSRTPARGTGPGQAHGVQPARAPTTEHEAWRSGAHTAARPRRTAARRRQHEGKAAQDRRRGAPAAARQGQVHQPQHQEVDEIHGVGDLTEEHDRAGAQQRGSLRAGPARRWREPAGRAGSTVEAAYRKRGGRTELYMMMVLMTPSAAGSTPMRGSRIPAEDIRATSMPRTNSGAALSGSMYRNQYPENDGRPGLTTNAQSTGMPRRPRWPWPHRSAAPDATAARRGGAARGRGDRRTPRRPGTRRQGCPRRRSGGSGTQVFTRKRLERWAAHPGPAAGGRRAGARRARPRPRPR